MATKNYKILRCWRCDRSAMVDMNTVKRDTRNRPLFTCDTCEQALEKLDQKGL